MYEGLVDEYCGDVLSDEVVEFVGCLLVGDDIVLSEYGEEVE